MPRGIAISRRWGMGLATPMVAFLAKSAKPQEGGRRRCQRRGTERAILARRCRRSLRIGSPSSSASASRASSAVVVRVLAGAGATHLGGLDCRHRRPKQPGYKGTQRSNVEQRWHYRRLSRRAEVWRVRLIVDLIERRPRDFELKSIN